MTRSVSCVSSHATTCTIDPPLHAAASRIGAKIFSAAAYQNASPSTPEPERRAVRTSQSATRCAPCQVRQPINGVQPAVSSRPVLRVGSYTQVFASGIDERAVNVSCSRSVLTDVATTGPGHSRIAGMANPVVLPVWVGPITIADCRGSAKTSLPLTRPSVKRTERPPRRRRRSPERAHCALCAVSPPLLRRAENHAAVASAGSRSVASVA